MFVGAVIVCRRCFQANFCARLRSAIIFREHTKAAIRFQHFVDSSPSDAIAPVSDSWLKSIHTRSTSFVARQQALAAAKNASKGGKRASTAHASAVRLPVGQADC